MRAGQGISRRIFLQRSWMAGAAVLAAGPAFAQTPSVPTGPFSLPPLPYPYDALEPAIDARTMEIHHTKHHAAYINKLNLAVRGTPWASRSIEEIVSHLDMVPDAIRTAVRNNGGGHYNHSLFWTIMGPHAGGEPQGPLADGIEKDLGGFARFRTAFSDAAANRFGSGWAWLSVNPQGRLVVESTPNQDSPLTAGNQPILGIDVWEHAYYLQYQNRRPDYIAAFFDIINWDAVHERYQKAIG